MTGMVTDRFAAFLGVLAGCVGMLIGNYMGYVWAHDVVARECTRLGGFYVGKTVYKCTKEQP